jgi:hypothetical protein
MVFDDFVKISDQRADQVPSFAGPVSNFLRRRPTTQKQQAHHGCGRDREALISLSIGFNYPLPCPCGVSQLGKWQGAAAACPNFIE